MTQTSETDIEERASELVELIKTYAKESGENEVDITRGIAREMLRQVEADGLGGCRLCQG